MKIQAIAKFTVGKTTVTVIVDGCCDCGAPASEGCETGVIHMFQMGDRRNRIELKRCASCAEKRGAKWPSDLRAQQHSIHKQAAVPPRLAATV